MCSGDAAGYRREALIGFTLIFKAVYGDRDFVDLALPLPHKARSGFESPARVVLCFGN
jgi:hypothetical protein